MFIRGVTIQKKRIAIYCNIFNCIAIYSFPYIFTKIKLISQYASLFWILRNNQNYTHAYMTVWRPYIKVYMWQACNFWTCNCYRTRIKWKLNSLDRSKKNRDILRYEFHIAIRYKFFVYCDIAIYRYIVTPLVFIYSLRFEFPLSRYCITCKLQRRKWYSGQMPAAKTQRKACLMVCAWLCWKV